MDSVFEHSVFEPPLCSVSLFNLSSKQSDNSISKNILYTIQFIIEVNIAKEHKAGASSIDALGQYLASNCGM